MRLYSQTYFKPLKIRILQSDHKILTDRQISKVFQNIEDIKNTAKALWKKLEEACKNWPESTPRVGAIFLAMIPEIKSFYVPYCKGISDALKNLSKLKKKNHQFEQFLDRTERDAAASSNEAPLPVSALLLLPITRLGQYENCLRDLMVLTPSEHVDYPTLAKAAREISNIFHECVPSKVEAQKQQRLFNITSNTRGPNLPHLLTKDARTFVREGPILIMTEKRARRSHIYLFTDSLIVAEVNELTEDRSFDQMLSLQGLDIRDVLDSSEGQHRFALTKENRKVVFAAATYEEKRSWMADIAGLITSQTVPRRPTGPNSLNSLSNYSRTSSSGSGGNQLFSGMGSDSIPPNSPLSSRSGDREGSSLSGTTLPGVTIAGGSSAILSPRTKKGKLAGLIQSEAFLRALERQHSNKQLEDFIDVIPAKIKLIKLSHKECIVKFDGPLDSEYESEKYTAFASARSLSTYPFIKKKNQRDGDPIADHYGLAAWHNRILASVADGCSLGAHAQQAASRAVDTNLSDFTESKNTQSDLREIAMDLLKSMAHVHETIIHGKKLVWDAGTTTMLTGLLVEVEPSPQVQNANWCFVSANVGDCKSFLWSKSSGQVSEITQGSRLMVSDPSDPGGRLGPYVYQGAPDLRNLQFFYAPCALDDMVVLCTDGVHENLDPELNGLLPKDLTQLVANMQGRVNMNLRPDQLTSRWDQLDPIKADALKTLYRNTLLEKIFSELESPPDPRQVTKALINFCNKNTRSAREYVEQNEKQLPVDHQLYPGRMDHATCLVFQVGPVQIS